MKDLICNTSIKSRQETNQYLIFQLYVKQPICTLYTLIRSVYNLRSIITNLYVTARQQSTTRKRKVLEGITFEFVNKIKWKYRVNLDPFVQHYDFIAT